MLLPNHEETSQRLIHDPSLKSGLSGSANSSSTNVSRNGTEGRHPMNADIIEPEEPGRRRCPDIARVREATGEARRGRSPLRVLVLDRSPRGAEDQAGAAQRLREPVHGSGSAVRGALGLVRARADPGRRRPDPGAGPRHPGTSAPGTARARGCSRTSGGRTAPYNLCPRQALKRVVRDAGERRAIAGFAGSSPSSSPCAGERGKRPVKAFDDDPLPGEGVRPRRQAFGYDARVLHGLDGIFSASLIDILEELGWGLKDVVAEGAYSQFELDFGYTTCRRDGGPAGVPARAAQGGREEARHVHHLHAQADRRRLALGRAHQLLDAADRRPGSVNLFEDPEGGGWTNAVYHAVGGPPSPRRSAHRHRLLDGQLLQRPRASGRRASRGAR